MSRNLSRAFVLGALIFGIGKLFRFRAWKMAHEPGDRHWTKHRHGSHGPTHPWFWRWEGPSEEESAQTEAGEEPVAAGIVV